MNVRYLAIGAALLAVGLAVAAFAPKQGPGYDDGWADGWGPMGGMGLHAGAALPPELAFLREIPPAERFDHFLGATVTFTNLQGSRVVVDMTPGTVTAVSATSLTIRPNGQTTERQFAVTPSTVVYGGPTHGTFQSVANGDKVVVLTVQPSNNAVLIMRYLMPRVTPTPTTTAPGAAPSGATPTPAAPTPTGTP